MIKRNNRNAQKNNSYIVWITSFILCIIFALAGFLIGRVNSSSTELKSLEKSNSNQEEILLEKENELKKIETSIKTNKYKIKKLEKEISELKESNN